MIAVSIAAHDNTTYGKLLPVIQRLDGFGSEMRFESRRMEGIGVTIEIRSDVRLLPREEMLSASLRESELAEPRFIYISKDDVDAVRISEAERYYATELLHLRFST